MTRDPHASRGSALRPALGALVALSLLAGAACRAPRPESVPFWDQRDDANPERIDHDRWQAILDAYVSPEETGVNLFDYAALQASAADRERLTAYLDDLQAIDPRRLAADEQMAYWINLYNALTVQVVLGDYPVESIREIHEGVIPLVGPWGDVHASVAGQPLTLDDIEHRILRPIWQDPRIHYAVNCAAYGCPHLLAQAFTRDNLEELLEQGAHDFVNHPRGVEVLDEAFAVASSIYAPDWYREDFGETDADVIAHFLEYAEPELAEQLRGFDGIMEFEYDWSLNAPPAAAETTNEP